ncbi:MAG: hypothetical protein R3E45_02715 [Rhodocyclaceae bacterium]
MAQDRLAEVLLRNTRMPARYAPTVLYDPVAALKNEYLRSAGRWLQGDVRQQAA